MTFEIPAKAREALLADGWDGVSVIEPDGQGQLPVDAPEQRSDADADIDAIFGPGPKPLGPGPSEVAENHLETPLG